MPAGVAAGVEFTVNSHIRWTHLFNGGDCDDKEQWQSAGDRTGGSVNNQLKWPHTRTYSEREKWMPEKVSGEEEYIEMTDSSK